MSRFLGVTRHGASVWFAIPCLIGIACDEGGEGEPLHDASELASDAGDAAEPDAAEVASDLGLAPAAFELAEGLAIPMDIVSVDARLVFDAAAGEAHARAELTFRTGDQAGRPVFDLRQTPQRAQLDGEAFDVAGLAHHALSGPYGSEMRVIDAPLPARSEHVLVLEYPLQTPVVLVAHDVAAPEFDAGSVRWAFNLADYTAAHFLEQWLPANLIFDRHALRVELELTGTDVPHALVTTGEVEELGENHFEIRFPPTTAAHSPLLVLRPESELATRSVRHELPDGAKLEVRIATLSDADVDLAVVEQLVIEALDDFVRSVGPYQHGDRFTLFVGARYGMEYDGGATLYFEYDSGAASGSMNPSRRVLRHEVFHSWFGRGMQPVAQQDGWIDEAWNMYLNDMPEGPLAAQPLPEGHVATLVGKGPYDRDMVQASDPYTAGPLVFAAIAERIGNDALTRQMRDFYLAHRGQRYDTALLERALVCANDDAAIREIFQRGVYGKSEPAPSLDRASFCAAAGSAAR